MADQSWVVEVIKVPLGMEYLLGRQSFPSRDAARFFQEDVLMDCHDEAQFLVYRSH